MRNTSNRLSTKLRQPRARNFSVNASKPSNLEFGVKLSPNQHKIARCVTQNFESGTNCMVENVDDGDKATSLLAASIKWLKNLKEQNPLSRKYPKIYFAAKSHGDIKKVIENLKKFDLGDLKISHLSSRRFMCINEHNKRLSNANFMCQMMTANIRQTISCPFYSNTIKAIRQDMSYNSKKSSSSSPNPLLEIKHKPVDANTVLGFAKDLDICPYFISKYFSHDADLIFITQQALLKQSTANLLQVDFDDNIFILDGCKQIEELSCMNYTYTIDPNFLEKFATKIITSRLFKRSNIGIMSGFARFVRLKIAANYNRLQLLEMDTTTGSTMLHLMNKIGMRQIIFDKMDHMCNQLNSFKLTQKTKQFKEPVKLSMVEELVFNCRKAFSSPEKYVMHLLKLNKRKYIRNIQVAQFNILMRCISPSIAFEPFKKARSVIIADDTINPLWDIRGKLGLQMSECIKYKPSSKLSTQIFGALVPSDCRSPTQNSLPLCIDDISKLSAHEELYFNAGKLLLHLSKAIPEGIVVAFPSPSSIVRAEEIWTITGLKKELSKNRYVFTDLNVPGDYKDRLNVTNYLRSFTWKKDQNSDDKSQSSILLTTYSGSALNKSDMSGSKCRALICVGLPMPKFSDFGFRCKRQLNLKDNPDGIQSPSLATQAFINRYGFTAINSVLSKVLLHQKNWKAFFIMDKKFTREHENCRELLSNNFQPFTKFFSSTITMQDELDQFLANKSGRGKEDLFDQKIDAENRFIDSVF